MNYEELMSTGENVVENNAAIVSKMLEANQEHYKNCMDGLLQTYNMYADFVRNGMFMYNGALEKITQAQKK